MEVKFPAIVVEGNLLKIPINKRGAGGFTFDGSNLVVELEAIDAEAAVTSETPRRGRPRKQEDEGEGT